MSFKKKRPTYSYICFILTELNMNKNLPKMATYKIQETSVPYMYCVQHKTKLQGVCRSGSAIWPCLLIHLCWEQKFPPLNWKMTVNKAFRCSQERKNLYLNWKWGLQSKTEPSSTETKLFSSTKAAGSWHELWLFLKCSNWMIGTNSGKYSHSPNESLWWISVYLASSFSQNILYQTFQSSVCLEIPLFSGMF